MQRRKFLALALAAPISLLNFGRAVVGGRYRQVSGWVLKSDDF